MNTSSFFIGGSDGIDIFVRVWDHVENPKGVVQIFHGMAEHSGRYDDFASFLNQHGFIVYANDHRGHGKTAGSIDSLGYIGEDGFNKTVEDEYIIKKHIESKHPDLQNIVFAHSFGSFVAQRYISLYGNEISGLILSGSAKMSGFFLRLGKFIALLEMKLTGPYRKSKLMNYLNFHSYNKNIPGNLSPSDWISSVKSEVEKFENDPYCGTVFTTNFYYYFLDSLINLYNPEQLDQIPRDLPIYIVSGEEDPVGNYGKFVRDLYELYLDLGISSVDLKLYKDARHELINEYMKYDFFDDTLDWIEKTLLSR